MSREKAKELLNHYLSLANAQGIDVFDKTEIEQIVDEIVDAAKRELARNPIPYVYPGLPVRYIIEVNDMFRVGPYLEHPTGAQIKRAIQSYGGATTYASVKPVFVLADAFEAHFKDWYRPCDYCEGPNHGHPVPRTALARCKACEDAPKEDD